MTTDDNDLERRLRSTLRRTEEADRLDSERFLARVHRGARVRRVRQVVAVAAAVAVVGTGGTLAVQASGLLSGPESPVAAPHPPEQSDLGTATTIPPSGRFSSSGRRASPSTATSLPPPTGTGRASASSAPTVTITPPAVPDAATLQPLSLTATGSMHQWVLARAPGSACGQPDCAVVLATKSHGAGGWSDLGVLPAPAASADRPTRASVSGLRFALRTDGSGTYDGWAFGGALWSTHDSGRSWSADASPAGFVTALEPAGQVVYAAVSSSVPGSDTATLFRSPTSYDDWQPVTVDPRGLTSVSALAASVGVVGLVDSGPAGHPVVYLSPDGSSWQRTAACPPGTDPVDLSTASVMAPTMTRPVSALWVTCRGTTSTVVRVTDTSALGSWRTARAPGLPAAAVVAGRTLDEALVATSTALQRISTSRPPQFVPVHENGVPVFLGFTNDSDGYLLTSDGSILATTNGGRSWSPYTLGSP